MWGFWQCICQNFSDKPESPIPVTLEDKSILTANCDCVKGPEPWQRGRERSNQGSVRKEGEDFPFHPRHKGFPLRLPDHQRPLTHHTLTAIFPLCLIPTSNLPPAQILSLKSLKLHLSFPHTPSLFPTWSPHFLFHIKGLTPQPLSKRGTTAAQHTLNYTQYDEDNCLHLYNFPFASHAFLITSFWFYEPIWQINSFRKGGLREG